MVEIDILKGGQSPQHVCPYAYLDESIKDDTLNKLYSLFSSWESYIDNKGLYDESSPIIQGCLTLSPIDG